MKVAINGAYIQEQASGLGVVTNNLVRELIDCDRELNFTLYSHANSLKTQYPQNIISVNKSISPDRGFLGHIKRLLWYQTSLNWQLKNSNTDLFFSPASEGMLFPSVPQIVTVHDLIPLKYPEVSPKWKYYYLYILPLILKQCRQIISISEHTKKDLIENYKLNPELIKVVYNGLDRDLFFPQPNLEILAKYNLNKYLLYVGDMRFYKNLDRCLIAFDKLPLKDYQFVITGKKDDFFYPKLQQQVDRLSAQERIIFLDYVPAVDLPSLYSMAQCLVFASLYEGFGLPILEAMACGCPVIASDRTSIPEVGGDSIFYVDPYDVEDIIQGMYELLTNNKLRQDLSNKGRERAKQFSWEKTAESIVKIFTSV
ncbi:glycosyltransferase family 4 protein [Waterburya agarophytonicola K14]|uniref:Glycosyltransferase family 4 protein n=1 Tax=Waterburya agarophytonicola KI4 TaxID=2874699 RepID=A0A964BS79_9CYAN|nr:glycosyltransferase family 1 protein [Waterburya agarophytonicola]MCC0176885.1 glycosyltransferase family 4 protein [Waterburya agarophytonicola KI4]